MKNSLHVKSYSLLAIFLLGSCAIIAQAKEARPTINSVPWEGERFPLSPTTLQLASEYFEKSPASNW